MTHRQYIIKRQTHNNVSVIIITAINYNSINVLNKQANGCNSCSPQVTACCVYDGYKDILVSIWELQLVIYNAMQYDYVNTMLNFKNTWPTFLSWMKCFIFTPLANNQFLSIYFSLQTSSSAFTINFISPTLITCLNHSCAVSSTICTTEGSSSWSNYHNITICDYRAPNSVSSSSSTITSLHISYHCRCV